MYLRTCMFHWLPTCWNFLFTCGASGLCITCILFLQFTYVNVKRPWEAKQPITCGACLATAYGILRSPHHRTYRPLARMKLHPSTTYLAPPLGQSVRWLIPGKDEGCFLSTTPRSAPRFDNQGTRTSTNVPALNEIRTISWRTEEWLYRSRILKLGTGYR